MDEKTKKELHLFIGERLADIEEMFVEGAKVTLLVRNPSLKNADILVTNDDDLKAVRKAINKLWNK